MRKMSLDVGTRTIGIAVSDLMGMIANGVETIRRTTEEKDYARIAELIKEHEVDTLVVGYPKNMNGTEGPRSAKCQAFARELAEATGIEVVLYDERLTTVSAHKILSDNNVRGKKRKATVDALSARLILEDYLTWKKRHEGNGGDGRF